MHPDPSWRARATSAADVVSHVRSGARVFVHGAAATPITLLDALAARADLEAVQLYHLHTLGTASFVAPARRDQLRSVSLFVGPDVRAAVDDGRADFMPVFLSDIPALFSSGAIPLDVALVQLSPPDRHGLMSLGTSVGAVVNRSSRYRRRRRTAQCRGSRVSSSRARALSRRVAMSTGSSPNMAPATSTG